MQAPDCTCKTSNYCSLHRMTVSDVKVINDELEAQLSRLKEILKGRDEALEKIRDLNILEARKSIGEQRPFEVLTKIMSVCDEALSKTWEEGEK